MNRIKQEIGSFLKAFNFMESAINIILSSTALLILAVWFLDAWLFN